MIDLYEEKANEFAQEAQEWIKKVGISDGLRPFDMATREEVWTMLYRFALLFHRREIRP